MNKYLLFAVGKKGSDDFSRIHGSDDELVKLFEGFNITNRAVSCGAC
jgi:hypothetical protein